MTDVQFGRLQDLPLREAWKHEAHSFTPWLAENIDHLSEAIGIPLELTGTEVAVETFSADILARNTIDDTVVLIENQLESTDHTHLGQIMTYLAGLDANTVVWIAPEFRQPHLTAIRWLNEHTADGFSFFAVRLRVVRIGDSPVAPIFEIAEKPDRWTRQLRTEAKREDLKQIRKTYFEHLNAAVTEIGLEQQGQSLVVPVSKEGNIRIVIEIGRSRAGIWVGADGVDEFGDLSRILLEAAPGLESNLAPIRETRWGGALYTSTGCELEKPETWTATVEWHAEKLRSYFAALTNERGEA